MQSSYHTKDSAVVKSIIDTDGDRVSLLME